MHNQIRLPNNITIPSIGFGIHHLDEGALAIDTTYNAIKTGWRLLETASSFFNEKSLGLGIKQAIDEGIVKREDLIISTKLQDEMQGFEFTNIAFQDSLKKLGVDYIDIFAIRLPLIKEDDWKTPLIDSWRAMEELYNQGKIKVLAVSNFAKSHLEFLLENAKIKPIINQLEIHPKFQQKGLQKLCKDNNIIVSSWRSLEYGVVCYNSTIQEIAEKYNKTPAQIVLRWHIQQGRLPITRTTHFNRMKENIDIFNFEISQEDMEKVNNLQDPAYKSNQWPTETIRIHGGNNE